MLEFCGVSAGYGEKTVLENVSLLVEAGEHAALMGPSGCGKTTLLYLAASLKKPSAGEVLRESDRIAAVFQEPRLLPWMNAAENIALVLKKEESQEERVLKALRRARLSDAAGKLPAELSGGMQQRVSLARALAFGGDLFLLDEPLKGLDEALREEMAAWINEATRGKTMLLVTHDPKEAESLCDSIYEFKDKTFLKKTPQC